MAAQYNQRCFFRSPDIYFIFGNNKFTIIQFISIRCKSAVPFALTSLLLTSCHCLCADIFSLNLCHRRQHRDHQLSCILGAVNAILHADQINTEILHELQRVQNIRRISAKSGQLKDQHICVGHAPKKCKICGKWFLTTNARHTKYCGGFAPGDKLRRTCRQIGNLKGREQRELADDHPVKQIHEKRLNTINRYIKRGTLDEDLAEVMKKLAKDKMLQALSNVAYAKGDYEKEMGQAALKKEALKRI